MKSKVRTTQTPVKKVRATAAQLARLAALDQVDQLAAENEELREAQNELEESRNGYAQLYDFAPVGYVTLSSNGRIEDINLTGARMLGCERERIVGSQFNTFVHGSVDLRHLLGHLRECRRGTPKVLTRLEIKARDGRAMSVQLHSSAEGSRDGVRYLTAMTDLSEQAHFERALGEKQEDLRRLNESLEFRVQQRTEELRTSEMLKKVIFEAIAAEVIVLNAQGEIIECNQTAVELAQSALFQVARPSINYLEVCRRAAAEDQDGAAQVAAGIAAVLGGSLRKFHVEYRKAGDRGVERWYSLVVTPLPGGAGAVLFHEDVSERKHLERQLLEISEQERRRIGQDLHDGLCQHLTGTALMAAGLARSLAESPVGERVLEIASFIRTAVDQTRHVARGLHPVEIDRSGLVSALQELADEISTRVPCELHCVSEVNVADSEAAVNLFRIAQEAVTNVLKHAQAQRIVINLKKTGAYLVMTIEDDGVGLRQTPHSAKGMGVNIMKYRASTLGAKFDLVGQPEGGARVRVSLPLPQTEQGEEVA